MKEAAQRYQYALRKFPREGFVMNSRPLKSCVCLCTSISPAVAGKQRKTPASFTYVSVQSAGFHMNSSQLDINNVQT